MLLVLPIYAFPKIRTFNPEMYTTYLMFIACCRHVSDTMEETPQQRDPGSSALQHKPAARDGRDQGKTAYLHQLQGEAESSAGACQKYQALLFSVSRQHGHP